MVLGLNSEREPRMRLYQDFPLKPQYRMQSRNTMKIAPSRKSETNSSGMVSSAFRSYCGFCVVSTSFESRCVGGAEGNRASQFGLYRIDAGNGWSVTDIDVVWSTRLGGTYARFVEKGSERAVESRGGGGRRVRRGK